MSDVAKLAGVATMTVSRVINDHRHVTEDTRRRVFEAITQLGYRPNTLARSLREQRSRQIGIIVPNIHDPFFAICAQAVSSVARSYDYSVSIAMSDENPAAECNEAILMMQRNVEGVIVVPTAGTQLTRDEFAGLPIVALDRPIPQGNFDSVVVENRRGTQLAVKHLSDLGHRRIAFFGLPLNLYTMKKRSEGYLLGMKVAGAEPEMYCGIPDADLMRSQLKKLLTKTKKVTAIVCANNLTTRNVLHYLREQSIRVPEDLAIVGFDDFEMAELLNPPVTVVSQPAVEMGRSGAELLFARILGKKAKSKPKQIILPVELIVRLSCGTA
jgi:LacI family transcriptional regulator